MDTVTVAELKARLSHYLREVREGRSFTVLSRDIPVATLGPYEPPTVDDFEIIEPTEDPALWGRSTSRRSAGSSTSSRCCVRTATTATRASTSSSAEARGTRSREGQE